MKYIIVVPVLLLAAAGCQTVPPPDPITADEIVHLSEGGPENPALITALETRPLGFPITYQGLQDLEARGVPADVIDTVTAYAVERRARQIAPRYTAYNPWYGYGGLGYPWSFRWGFGIGYHHYHCR